MVKLKCKNCNKVFEKFCDKEEDSRNVVCPSCGSHWVVIFEEKPFILPKPNTDVIPYPFPKPYPKPFRPHPDIPFPNRYWISKQCSGDPIIFEMRFN